jgi:2-keto-4-pentenoate hydratase/2-oxohepta-3-ene-1,7-dioic acid hydratase in catechol pathway
MTTFSLLSFQSSHGPRAGALTAAGVIDIADATGESGFADIIHVLEAGPRAIKAIEKVLHSAPQLALDTLHLLSPIPHPSHILCAGANYADHAAEMARANGREPPKDPHEQGLRSWHFLKSSRSLVASGGSVALPRGCHKLDWEAELAVVIGRPARYVSEAEAMDYVAGYTIANDLSARDFSRRDKVPETSSFKSDWVAHKSFDGACPLGPSIILARDVRNPHALGIELDVNGVVKQKSNTAQMIFSIAEQIADLSARLTLWPGDIILTGTPAGVGNGRGEYLNAHDIVRVRIDGLGELVTTITAAV